MNSARTAMLFLILAISPIWAASLNITGQTLSDGIVQMQIAAELPNKSGEAFLLMLPTTPDEMTITDRYGHEVRPLPFQNGSGLVGAVVPGDYLLFNLVSNDWTSKTGEQWVFRFNLTPIQAIGPVNMRLSLPAGSTLHGLNRQVESKGSALVLVWSASRLAPNETMRMNATWNEPLPTMSSPSSSLANWPVVAALVVLGAAALYWRLKIRPSKTRPVAVKTNGDPAPESSPSASIRSNPLYKTLESADREIVAQIASEGGKTTQAHIYLNTHLPKATLSRHLKGLENRGLIRRSRQGLRKLVSLSEQWGPLSE